MSNILWVQDIDPRNSSGGAQMTDHYMIREFEKNNYNVIWSGEKDYDTYNYDLAVISNAKKYEADCNLYKELDLQQIPFVKYEHDHACVYRAFFPMADKCQGNSCPAKDKWSWQYRNANGIVYLSDWQKKAHNFWDGFALNRKPTLSTPSYIDYKLFMDADKKYGNERSEKDNLLLASLYPFKGYVSNTEYARTHENENFYHYGRWKGIFSNEEVSYIERRNIILKDEIKYDKIPQLMAKHNKFLHLSDNFLPFERVVMEAFFSGMEVITNKNVGATSYEWFGKLDESIEAMNNTRSDFVDFVLEVTK